MIEDIRNAAIAVTLKVFETMFFIPLELQDRKQEEGHPPLESPPSYLRGEITFQGKWSGKIGLYLPAELAKTMAANFMGSEEDEVSESKAIDMVSESCNVLCGNLLSQMDKKISHTLRIPQTRPISLLEMEEDISPGEIAIDFNAEDHPVKLVIQLES